MDRVLTRQYPCGVISRHRCTNGYVGLEPQLPATRKINLAYVALHQAPLGSIHHQLILDLVLHNSYRDAEVFGYFF
jgi:hypothetical protein